MIDTAMEVWGYQDGLVSDFSSLQYEWGDEMGDLVCHFWAGRGTMAIPAATVVGPGCERAIATLLFGEDTQLPATHADWIFDDLEAAIQHVRARRGRGARL